MDPGITARTEKQKHLDEEHKQTNNDTGNNDSAHRQATKVARLDIEGRKVDRAAEQVAAHYNSRKELGIKGRLHTAITGLRIFNNWVKSVIISQNTRPGFKVLDLGCGKGGDLRKWAFANISEYVGMGILQIDIADVSVEQARQRYLGMRNARFRARFFAQDCYGDPLEKTLDPPDYKADIISAQFCLHYAFDTEKRVRQTLKNISSHLVEGGKFICTIPNANWLVKKMESENSTRFGNKVYNVEFNKRRPISRYGFGYSFTLDNAVEDCTEYLVHMPSFIELAREYNLELVYSIPFHKFYVDNIRDPSNARLFSRMSVVTEDRPEITSDEWEAVGIYLAVGFAKSTKK